MGIDRIAAAGICMLSAVWEDRVLSHYTIKYR